MRSFRGFTMKQLTEMLIKVRRKIKHGIRAEEMIPLHILGSLYTADLYIEKLGNNRKILRLLLMM